MKQVEIGLNGLLVATIHIKREDSGTGMDNSKQRKKIVCVSILVSLNTIDWPIQSSMFLNPCWYALSICVIFGEEPLQKNDHRGRPKIT